jgi:DNA anti-recombination protein RmuC
MDGLREYASVVTAAVSVIAALAVLGLWAINAQVTPEINRVDGRMDNYETQYTELKERLGRMDQRLERRLDRIDNRFIQIDKRFGEIDERFSQIDGRFVQMESRINQRFDDMATNINTILARLPAPADQAKQ